MSAQTPGPRFQTASPAPVEDTQFLPCPFCASTDVHRVDITQHEAGGRFICGALMQCRRCSAQGPEVDCDGDEPARTAAAFAAWNCRTTAPAPAPPPPAIQHGNADVRSEHAYLRPMTPAEEAREANLRG